MKEILRQIFDKYGHIHYGKAVRRDPALLEWVTKETSHLPATAELAERIYNILFEATPICPHGNHKKFNTITKGYRFCAHDCQCRREEQSRKMTLYHAVETPEQKQQMMANLRQTMQQNYQVDNAMHLKWVKDKVMETEAARYPSGHHSRESEVQAKTRETSREIYGVDHFTQADVVKKARENTCMDRYGEPTSMRLAREAFKEQTGVANPFYLPEIQEQARRTRFETTGFEYPLQNPAVYDQVKQGWVWSIGVDNPMKAAAIIDARVKAYNEIHRRNNPMQLHYNDDVFDLLQDQLKFTTTLNATSIRELSMKLNIGYDTIRKYAKKYGIKMRRSSYETSIAAFLESHGFTNLITNNKTILQPVFGYGRGQSRELDIVIDELKIAIEFCGLWWHQEAKRNQQYHLEKLHAAQQVGYRLIQIFEDEWVFKNEIVKSRLQAIIGKSARGKGARSLSIRHITSKQATQFLSDHHIQGIAFGSMRYGAYDGEQLIAVMTFCRPRRSTGKQHIDGTYELLRFATDGKNYPGIASRLFQTFVTEVQPAMVYSYADLRWSDGNLYRRIGFKEIGETGPNYWYFKKNTVLREHRFRYRHDRIKNRVVDGDKKSESVIMEELNYVRIYDCGSLYFEWRPSPVPS